MIAAGHTQPIDLGAVRERRFAIMASFGFDADVVHRADACRRGNISKWNYLQPIGHSLRKYQHPVLRAFLDGAPEPLAARLAVVVNLPVYALGLKLAATAAGDDGLLDVRLFERGSAFQILRYFYNVARGTHENLRDVTTAQARRIRFEADVPVPIQVDGDPAGWTPAEIRVLPRALELIVPAERAVC
jgi:diacylglycerol kinase family enzyme